MFLWGFWEKTKEFPTYFSAFLSPAIGGRKVPDEKLYVTPIADEFIRYWSGRYPEERAPILTRIALAGGEQARDAIVPAGRKFPVTVTVDDPSGASRPLRYRWWILNDAGKPQFGPVDTDAPTFELPAPDKPGQAYFVKVYVVAEERYASGFSVPFKVE